MKKIDFNKLDLSGIFLIFYLIGSWATFIYLSFFDDYQYNWWNWVFVLPINFFLGHIWPLYWIIIKPLMG